MNVIERNTAAASPLEVYGVELSSRLLLGTARYPSPQVMGQAIKAARSALIPVSVRREAARAGTGQRFPA